MSREREDTQRITCDQLEPLVARSKEDSSRDMNALSYDPDLGCWSEQEDWWVEKGKMLFGLK